MWMIVRRWVVLFCVLGAAQGQDWPKEWWQPTEPFHIIGPVYYVGGRELTAYLVTDPEGHVLINVGMDENVPEVFKSMRKLGFDPKDLRYLLITQAHFDHGGGAAKVQEQTGAEVLCGQADVRLLKSGGLGDYVFGDALPFARVQRVRGLDHEEVVRVGKIRLKTISTPGHTEGSSSWLLEHDGQTILFQGSISLLGNAKLVDNPRYANPRPDFQKSIQRLQSLKPDYILPDHLQFAHPKGVTFADAPQVGWFRDQEIITRQVTRTQRALDRHQHR